MNRKNLTIVLISFFIVNSCNTRAKEIEIATSTGKNEVLQNVKNIKHETDSAGCIKLIQNFMRWYKKNIDESHKIELAKRIGKDSIYRVDFNNTDRYLKMFIKSGYFADSFIIDLKKYFEMCDKYYFKTKPTEIPLDGLNSDLILQTQEYDEILGNLPQLKFKEEKREPTYTIIRMSYSYIYWIIKCDLRCKIIGIEVGQEEHHS